LIMRRGGGVEREGRGEREERRGEERGEALACASGSRGRRTLGPVGDRSHQGERGQVARWASTATSFQAPSAWRTMEPVDS
jgi:hypothetical protein